MAAIEAARMTASSARLSGQSRSLSARDGLIAAICLAMFVLNAVIGIADGFVGWTILTATLLVAVYPHASTSLGIVGLFTGITVFVVPMMALIYVDAGVMPAWIGLYIIVLRVMIAYSPESIRLPEATGWAGGNLIVLSVILIASLVTQALVMNELFFHVLFACSLINLERLHASTQSLVLRLVGLAIALFALLVYSLLYWTGYGRLILSTFALAPLIISVHYGTFRIPMMIFAAAAASLVFIGRVLRFGVGEGIAGLADDSGASPLTMTEVFWDSQITVFWNEPFWHQWSLLFLSWFPRAWWADKPMGLNYTLVDAVLGRQGFGDDHSTAVSFLGEQIFLAADWWILSTALVAFVLIFLFRTVASVATPYFAPVAIAHAWLVSFFWGGMATYGSRVWFSVVPMIVYIIILRWTVDHRQKAQRRVAGAI